MKVILAKPRGFCGGVERAIKSVQEALHRYGTPVYVLNDIVHNAHVVNDLQEQGAVFVKDLKDVPPGSYLLFSAHGVAPERYLEAEALGMKVIDATCPLVEKVHNEARRFAAKGFTIILIGEAGHDEVVGTSGWASGRIKVVFTEEDVARLEVEDETQLAYVTQTTLSVGDAQRVIAALKARFPNIQGPHKEDICYATQNRQAAVNALASQADLVLVVGDRASANSARLAQICRTLGKESYLISSAAMIRDEWLNGAGTVLVTSGASVPEGLVQDVVAYLRTKGASEVNEVEVTSEDVHFKLPPALSKPA